jgi:hypothetical protein
MDKLGTGGKETEVINKSARNQDGTRDQEIRRPKRERGQEAQDIKRS